MLKIVIKPNSYECWNPDTEEFETHSTKGGVMLFENSLVAIAEWESRTHKPYFKKNALADIGDLKLLLECMDRNQNGKELYDELSDEQLAAIIDYLGDNRTATKISGQNPNSKTEVFGGKSEKAMTTEQVYARMFTLGIPIECENWNVNRLIMLIQVMGLEGSGGNTMSAAERNAFNRALNASRR